MKTPYGHALQAFFAANQQRLDANETAFLERELTQLRSKIYEVKYAELMARSFIPIATDIAASADTYSFPVLDQVGQAKVIANGPDDLPRVDVKMTEVTGKVYTVGDSYGWTLYELMEAARVARPLSQMKARAARRAMETEIDAMLCTGQTTQQSNLVTTGLLNNAAVDALGVATMDHWVLNVTSGDQQVAEINAVVNEMIVTSKQVFIPDTVLLPTARFNVLANTRLANSDLTALDWLLKTNKRITSVMEWYKLDGAGVGGKDRMVVYKRDPEVLEGVVPQEFMQLPPQPRNLEFVVNCTARAGGTKVYQPLGIRYADFDAS